MHRRTTAKLGGLSLLAAFTGCREPGAPPASATRSAGPSGAPATSSGRPGAATSEPPPATSSNAPPTAVTGTADRYAWFEKNDELTDGFCLTWTAAVTPAEFMTRIGARRLGKAAWPDWPDFTGLRTGEGVVALTRTPRWTLAVEDNGVLGLRDDLLKRLSKGTTVVCHYRNVELDSRFLLLRDGDIRVDFDPFDPQDRAGSHPSELLADMRAAGFGLTPDVEEPVASEAAFALTERLTGVPMTVGLLHKSAYLVTALYDEAIAEFQRLNHTRRFGTS